MILEKLQQEPEIELIEPTETSSVLEITEENITAHLKQLTAEFCSTISFMSSPALTKEIFEADFRQIVDRFDFIMTGPTAMYQGQLVEAYAYKCDSLDEISPDPDQVNFIYTVSYLMLLSEDFHDPSLKRTIRFGSLPRNK